MTAEFWGKVYDLLMKKADASPSFRDDFIRYWMDKNLRCGEWRFGGLLGFGGKLHHGPPPRVSCYPEEETVPRVYLIGELNEELRMMWRKANGLPDQGSR